MIVQVGNESYPNDVIKHFVVIAPFRSLGPRFEVLGWCYGQFGRPATNNWSFDEMQSCFWFTKQEDMLLFVMRWS